MDTVSLSGEIREQKGRGTCHRLRKAHKIPGVLYGRGKSNLMVEFSEMDINDLIKHYGEHALVELDVNGSSMKTMIKEIQRDPVDRSIKHIDMKYITDGEKVHIDVPVVLKGDDMIRSKGGIVQKQMGTLSVEADPQKIPKVIVADVSHLNIGEKLTLADVEFSSDITIADDMDSIIAVITSAKEKEKAQENIERVVLDVPATDTMKKQ